MKDNKDPYNFEKTEDFLKERKKAIGEMKQMYGKIYMKGPRAKSQETKDKE